MEIHELMFFTQFVCVLFLLALAVAGQIRPKS